MRRSQHPAVRTWHVYARGARRLALFYEDADYRQFLVFLREALILSGCALFGYVLMGNHYHLMLRGAQSQITHCMQRLNWRYALYHNDRHKMGGHVFDGPYKEAPQRTMKWLLWRLAYIFLNPVTAKMVDRAEDYPWSGYRSFMGLEGSPLEVDPLPELPLIAKGLDDARAYFSLLMREQEKNGKRRGSTTPTAREIQLDQFDWVRRQAQLRASSIQDVDTDTLALWWGHELGIPTGVMIQALGIKKDAARYRIRKLMERVAGDEDLQKRLVL